VESDSLAGMPPLKDFTPIVNILQGPQAYPQGGAGQKCEPDIKLRGRPKRARLARFAIPNFRSHFCVATTFFFHILNFQVS